MRSGVGWWLDQAGRRPLLTPRQELELGRTVRDWLDHPDGRDGCPALIRRRGRRARDRMIECNLRLSVMVAKRFSRLLPAESFGDLIQAGNVGLIEAVERFDPARGYKLSTYACFWIQMRVTAHIEQLERSIRLPTTLAYKVAAIPNRVRRLMATLGHEPTRENLAESLSMTPEELDRIFTIGRPTASLDAPLPGADGSFGCLAEVIAAPDDTTPVSAAVAALRSELERMPPLYRMVVSRFYGIGCGRCTEKELAQELQISAAAVGRILAQARKDLAQHLDPHAAQLQLALGDSSS